MKAITLADLRRYAIARTLFPPTTLARAMKKLGFVQADPIRAPARAQDLILRHRVKNYRAGDLERNYAKLDVEEDFFVNYGFIAREYHDLMHPRTPRKKWSKARSAKAQAVLAFVRSRGEVHPREVDQNFNHGKTTNYWGGSSNASTHLLDDMHYRGLLRVARRDRGVRIYAARDANATTEKTAPKLPPLDKAAMQANHDKLVDLAVSLYAPLPARSLVQLVAFLRGGAPQWSTDRKRAVAAAKERLASAHIDGIDWYWPAGENPRSARYRIDHRVRLLAPFDPIVWDRRRFEIFWGWPYRFEAYLPAHKRVRGYYALPMLWGEEMVGWCNVSVVEGRLKVKRGLAGRRVRTAGFDKVFEEELERMIVFLSI